MRVAIPLVIVLVFISHLSIPGGGIERENEATIQSTLDELCGRKSLERAFDCIPDDSPRKYLVMHDKLIPVNITPTKGKVILFRSRMKVKDGKEQVFRERVKKKVNAVIKFGRWEDNALENERENLIRLNHWKIGPTVYEVEIQGDHVPPIILANKIVMEFVDGKTAEEIFDNYMKELDKALEVPVDEDKLLELTGNEVFGACELLPSLNVSLIHQVLRMMIAIVEGVVKLWRRKYQHGDLWMKNIMFRFEKIGGEKRILLDKKHLVFIDPEAMTNISEVAPEDMEDALHDLWTKFYKATHTKDSNMKDLIQKVNDIVYPVSSIHSMLPDEGYETSVNILDQLKDIQRSFSTHKLHQRIRDALPSNYQENAKRIIGTKLKDYKERLF